MKWRGTRKESDTTDLVGGDGFGATAELDQRIANGRKGGGEKRKKKAGTEKTIRCHGTIPVEKKGRTRSFRKARTPKKSFPTGASLMRKKKKDNRSLIEQRGPLGVLPCEKRKPLRKKKGRPPGSLQANQRSDRIRKGCRRDPPGLQKRHRKKNVENGRVLCKHEALWKKLAGKKVGSQSSGNQVWKPSMGDPRTIGISWLDRKTKTLLFRGEETWKRRKISRTQQNLKTKNPPPPEKKAMYDVNGSGGTRFEAFKKGKADSEITVGKREIRIGPWYKRDKKASPEKNQQTCLTDNSEGGFSQ